MDNYQIFQKYTSKKDWDVNYLGVGLGGEVGELLNEIKKLHRDDNDILNQSRKNAIMLEMGDVLWYLAGIANKLDINFTDVIDKNIDKLSSN